jgi:hypothetical protein
MKTFRSESYGEALLDVFAPQYYRIQPWVSRSFIHSLPAGTSDFPATIIDCDEKIARRVRTEHRLDLCYFGQDRVITPDARREPGDKKIARLPLKRTLRHYEWAMRWASVRTCRTKSPGTR